MEKRNGLRQHFDNKKLQAQELEQYKQRTAQLNALENTVVQAFNALIRYMDGKTTKTEVVNQLKSISTPDIDKVVDAVSKLDKNILNNQLDLKPLVNELKLIKREMSLVPKVLPKIPQAKDSVKVTNLDEVKLDTKDLEKAIKNLKLNPNIEVKPADIHTTPVDLKPLKDVLLNVLDAIKSQKYPEFPTIEPTDLTKLEKEAKTHTKLLTEIKDKPTGGGGGGGNGTPYIDSTGKPVNIEVDANSLPYIKTALTEVIEVVDANNTYIGQALPGSSLGASVWRIKKIVVSGSTTTIGWAGGVGSFTKEWDERASYTYS